MRGAELCLELPAVVRLQILLEPSGLNPGDEVVPPVLDGPLFAES
jgi:hypothetical protein